MSQPNGTSVNAPLFRQCWNTAAETNQAAVIGARDRDKIAGETFIVEWPNDPLPECDHDFVH